jgi:hypothetical protein
MARCLPSPGNPAGKMQVPAAGGHRAAETKLTPESADHRSFIMEMSRGDAGNKEDTMNLLSPWNVVFFFIPDIPYLDFLFCVTKEPSVSDPHS